MGLRFSWLFALSLSMGACTVDRSGLVSRDGGPRPEDSGGVDADRGDGGPDGGGDLAVVGAAAGEGFTCALRSDGQVRCWGLNSDGQLGDGTNTSRAVSRSVVLPGPATQIAAGDTHACALVASGEVYCWGKNDRGQVGNDDPGGADARMPQRVSGMSDATFIATGGRHSCAIHGGLVSCWGDNAQEQTGMGPDAEYLAPRAVLGILGAPTSISLGDAHSCALAGGSVFCWGLDSDGQLGDGVDSSGGSMPRRATTIAGANAIGLGFAHSCAVAGGMITCWGDGGEGRLGNGVDTNNREEPTLVAMISNGAEVDGGLAHTCARQGDGSVLCWGKNDDVELGDPAASDPSDTPVSVTLTGPASSITVGAEHACAIVGVRLYCWGSDTNERLGSGATGGMGAREPTLVDDLLTN